MKSEAKQTPFTYLGMINKADQSEISVDSSVYNQFLINRGLSLHIDTIAIANELNKYSQMDSQLHFDFLRHMVSPRARFAKWPKPKSHADAALISEYYQISMAKAYDLALIIDSEQIEQIREELKVE